MIVRAKRLFSSKQALPPIQEAPIEARQEAPSPARQEAPALIVAHNDAEIAPRQEAFEGLLKKAKGAKEAKVQERLAQEPMEPLTPEEENIAQMEEEIREAERKSIQ